MPTDTHPDLAAAMQQAHHRIEQQLDALKLAASQAEAPDGRSRLKGACHEFCAALSEHHRLEDVRLFPRLRQANPLFGEALDDLMGDHERLAGHVAALEAATAAPEPDHDRVERAIDGVHRSMTKHFAAEEAGLHALMGQIEIAPDDLRRLFGEQ